MWLGTEHFGLQLRAGAIRNCSPVFRHIDAAIPRPRRLSEGACGIQGVGEV